MCEALENGYLEVLPGTTEINKKLTGRGEISSVEMTPKRKEMATPVDEIRTGGGAICGETIEAGEEM